MDKFEERRLALQRLVNLMGYGGIARIAQAIGKEPNYVSRMLYPPGKPGRKRIGEASADVLDQKFPGWMDKDALPIARPSEPIVAELQLEYIGPAPSQRLVAVVGQARLGENGWYDVVQEVGCDGFVEAVSNDPDAYALRVLGDSMFPAIRNGWYVVVEPNHALNPSDFVAVALTDGRKMVKEYLYRTADEVGLQSVNGNKRLTVPLAEIATMHPIGSLVSPGKHRTA